MTIFIAIGIVVCLAGLYTRVGGRRFEEVLPLSLFSVVLMLYVARMAGQLLLGRNVVLAVGVGSGLVCLYFLIREKRTFLDRVLTPGFAAFVLITLFFWWNSEGRVFMQWDDFSHWGLVVRNMHFFGKLGNVAEATTKFKDYPPATSLMAYFFTSFGSFNETNAIRGLGVMSYGCMLPLLRKVEWKQKQSVWGGAFLMVIAFLLPTALHKNTYVGLYVDAFLGVLYFFVVYAIVTYEAGWFRALNVAAGCMMLALTKASGTGLAAMAVVFVLVPLLLTAKDRTERKALLWDGIFGAAGLLIGKKSWDIYLSLSGTERAWSASEISLRGILDLFVGKAPEYRIITVKKFWQFFLTEPMGGWIVSFPLAVWFLLFVIFAVLFVYLCRPEDRKRFRAVFAGLIVGFVVYLLFLLVLYLFSYSEYEAMRLASCARYTNTYLIGMLGSYIGIYVWYFHREEKQMMLVPALALVATVLCMTNYGVNDVLIHPIEAAQTSQKLKDGYYGALRFQNKLEYTKDRVYVISQNSNGLDYWVLRNMFTPVQINANYTWSIGVKYGDGDVFTAYKNIYSWSDDLQQFDYVYLFRVDEAFAEQFGVLFDNPADIGNDRMYRVRHEGGELVQLSFDADMSSY